MGARSYPSDLLKNIAYVPLRRPFEVHVGKHRLSRTIDLSHGYLNWRRTRLLHSIFHNDRLIHSLS